MKIAQLVERLEIVTNEGRDLETAHKITVEEIDDFLIFIDMPTDCIGLSTVREVLPRLVRLIEIIGRYYEMSPATPYWKIIAEKLKTLPMSPTRNHWRHRPELWGMYEDYPIYTALWAIPKKGEISEIFTGLLAHACLARRILLERTNQKKYQNIFRTAPTCLRMIMFREFHDRVSVLNPNCDTSDLIHQIEKSELGEQLAPFLTLLKYSQGQKAPERTPQMLSRCDAIPVVHALTNDYDPVQGQDTLKIELIESKIPRDSQNKHLAPNEIQPFAPQIQTYHSSHQNNALSRKQLILLDRNMASTAIQAKNQYLPYQWSSLTNYEVECFLSAIINKNLHAPDGVYAQLAIILFCGQSIKRSAEFIYYRELPENPAPGLQYVDGDWFWIGKPHEIRYGNLNRFQPFLVKTTNFSRIRLPAICYKFLDAIPTETRPGYLVFLQNSDDVAYFLSDVLSHINGKKKTRITAQRLERYLFDRLTQINNGDMTAAVYLTGQEHYLTSTVMHYTATYHDDLVQQYQLVWQDIFAEGKMRPKNCSSHCHMTGKIIGSKKIPRKKAVQTVINDLKDNVNNRRDALGKKPTISELIRYHNALTRYVAIMVAYATGVRAVHSPIPKFSDIDFASGFCVLRDKDSSEGYHTRLIWLAPVCLSQLQAYQDHIRLLYAKISVIDQKFFSRVSINRCSAIEKELLFFDTQKRSRAVTPKTLHDFRTLPSGIILPANSNRHLLRSWLLRKGCPPEIIDAFLGHWFLGQEPWGPYSALSPVHYRKTLNNYLPDFLGELGFELINGFYGGLS
nr:hypothetical protein [uncultured Desulfuromonas sp.]